MTPRNGRWARLRYWWWRRIRRYGSELCQVCGRPVEVIWTAPNGMWAAITGHLDGSGVWCLRCFDAASPVLLRWVPEDA